MVQTLADVSENELLPRIWRHLPTTGPGVEVGPGDDAAVLAAGPGTVVTTDTMVRGADWLDEWSTGRDVGAKAVAQNLADVTAMGGRCTWMVLTLVADAATPVGWVEHLARGVGEAARRAGVSVVGGDLSSAAPGTRMVSVTALGRVVGRRVLRSGARVGDQVAVSGPLGRSGAGLVLLQRGVLEAPGGAAAECLTHHRAPWADPEAGEVAAGAGATSLMDVSDGLARDGARIATASGVRLVLDRPGLQPLVDRLAPAVGEEGAWEAVLTGGEEHCLLGTFPAGGVLPQGWHRIGWCEEADGTGGPAVTLDGRPVEGGWDHFRA